MTRLVRLLLDADGEPTGYHVEFCVDVGGGLAECHARETYPTLISAHPHVRAWLARGMMPERGTAARFDGQRTPGAGPHARAKPAAE